MIFPLLLRLVADLVFDSAAVLRRSFDADMSRYLERRGFRTSPPVSSR
jgi:hypothetical protein